MLRCKKLRPKIKFQPHKGSPFFVSGKGAEEGASPLTQTKFSFIETLNFVRMEKTIPIRKNVQYIYLLPVKAKINTCKIFQVSPRKFQTAREKLKKSFSDIDFLSRKK